MSTIPFYSKKVIITLALLFIILIAVGQPSPSCSCATAITQQDFIKYTGNYRANFMSGAGDKKHTEWIYLPKNYFVFLDNFLDLTPTADGVWIYFISHPNILDAGQQKAKEQILINIVASENKSPKYEKLRAYLKISSVLNNNNRVFLSTNNGAAISFIAPKHIFDFDELGIQQNSYRYKSNYSVSGILEKKYSERVHICRAHIKQIKMALEQSSTPVWNGVKLYFGSYNEKIECVKNGDEKQSTLLLLPVPNRKSLGDFDKYNSFLKYRLRITEADIYNHGELCPQSCN